MPYDLAITSASAAKINNAADDTLATNLLKRNVSSFRESVSFASLTEKVAANNVIHPSYYEQYEVKRGLRNSNGTGVLVGLTQIADVHGYLMNEERKVPTTGKLYYRGIDMTDLMRRCQEEERHGFEEVAYLILFGELPVVTALEDFQELLDTSRSLPRNFTENMILKAPSKDIMNKLQRSVLAFYSYDENPDDIGVANVLKQSIELIARFPTVISYGYQAKAHYFDGKSLYIHAPVSGIGTAENILHMIRKDNQYTKNEAEILDLCLVIHAEHGGGNNSAFANRVVSSSGTDTYSAISTAVGSLKGPKHGGANKQVKSMVDDIKQNCHNWHKREALKDYLIKILNREAYDGAGLIYGMGHAVYTITDPRAELLREKAHDLAREKNAEEMFNLYYHIETITKEILCEVKGPDFTICANVDLYSGFVYELLGIPEELYTPLFATARIAGWCAHRIEQIISDNKIMRPAYKSVSPITDYVTLNQR
ncbi:citrate/2-methylcitrate synthase [Anoxynatronum sibiricum]|uniref:citrate synthase (unknown stereospecificity) n=1 Tax=Anoxynatronum sibiricum TaxID=210623 RepID=A0ABU9VQB1_9CLOT